ncbi:MAG: hypothetical protein RIR00_854 [Pseudomonadota bacterium]
MAIYLPFLKGCPAAACAGNAPCGGNPTDYALGFGIQSGDDSAGFRFWCDNAAVMSGEIRSLFSGAGGVYTYTNCSDITDTAYVYTSNLDAPVTSGWGDWTGTIYINAVALRDAGLLPLTFRGMVASNATSGGGSLGNLDVTLSGPGGLNDTAYFPMTILLSPSCGMTYAATMTITLAWTGSVFTWTESYI